VGIECRSADAIHALLAPLHHADTADRVVAERALNKRLNGGCQVPIACYAVLEGEQLWLRGLVGQPSGGTLLVADARAPRANAEALGCAGRRRPARPGRRGHPQRSLWRGRPPVSPWRLLLTRPAEDCAALAQSLAEAGMASSQPAVAGDRSVEPTPAQRAPGGLQAQAIIVVSKPAAPAA
jgi:hypothetical protein